MDLVLSTGLPTFLNPIEGAAGRTVGEDVTLDGTGFGRFETLDMMIWSDLISKIRIESK